MGNSGSKESDPNLVVIHSFPLDPDSDFCMCPVICPGKQAMFHPPENFPRHLAQFVPNEDADKMLRQINKILRRTAYPEKQCGPLACFSLILTGLFFLPLLLLLTSRNSSTNSDENYSRNANISNSMEEWTKGNLAWLIPCCFWPFVLYFVLMMCMSCKRERSIKRFILNWNKAQGNGVFLSIGGVGKTLRGNSVGHEDGGKYRHFDLAVVDRRSRLMRGYLHVIVNFQARADWCQQNGVPFVPPVTKNQQQTAFQQQPVPYSPAGFQVPEGYALVPTGYSLVPHSQDVPQSQDVLQSKNVPQTQDVPPSYHEAKKM